MRSKAKRKSKGEGETRLKKDHATGDTDRICTTSSNEIITEANLGRFPDSITTQIETALRPEDSACNWPLLHSKTEDARAEATVTQDGANTNDNREPSKAGLFKRRLKLPFASKSLKLPGDSDRHGCQIHSPDKETRSERSSSGAASLTDSNTIGSHGSIHSPTKKSPTTPPIPKYLKYIRATNDYMFLDLDFLEADSSNKVIQGGPLSAMEGTNRQAAGVKHSAKKSPGIGAQDIKKGIQKQIEYIRSLTGTEVKAVSADNSKSPRRANDSRIWNIVNLRCTTCRDNCPICCVPCCRYAEAQQTIASTETKPEEVGNIKQILQMIERLANPVAATDVNASQILGNSAIGTIEDIG
ncbi:hypothetical protein BDV26DRAFT_286112 [Aspergillus bertholletiae]|uniref:Uncharacterized protein n=1 Tax=Aspergillus bertholletiae TaxID=1226010 RepID=A0A5N7ATQ1_9EURO|nr:hypothetical protein BDV26DRAFT_286112 [Aspergillus bertholletiae]